MFGYVKRINRKFDGPVYSMWNPPCTFEHTGARVTIKFLNLNLFSARIEDLAVHQPEMLDMNWIKRDIKCVMEGIKEAVDLFFEEGPRLFYYGIYVTTQRKTTLHENYKSDFDAMQQSFVELSTRLKHVANKRYSVKCGQRVLSSFTAVEKGKESRYVFRQYKKRRIVPSAMK